MKKSKKSRGRDCNLVYTRTPLHLVRTCERLGFLEEKRGRVPLHCVGGAAMDDGLGPYVFHTMLSLLLSMDGGMEHVPLGLINQTLW